jgi:hypothetical protein
MLILQVDNPLQESALQRRLRKAQTELRSSLVRTYLPALRTHVFTYDIVQKDRPVPTTVEPPKQSC